MQQQLKSYCRSQVEEAKHLRDVGRVHEADKVADELGEVAEDHVKDEQSEETCEFNEKKNH